MKTTASIFVLLLTYTAAFSQIAEPGSRMIKQWETGPGLRVPESVLYDVGTGIIYVSNIDGKSSEKDGAGSISTLGVDGRIIDANWVTGIDAPKGMAILNNHLFVSNIDEIVEIDIPTAKIVNRHHVEGSTFLNDVATDPKSGKVFISDTRTGQVYVLLNGKAVVWQQGPKFKSANGLFILGNFLFIGTGNGILQANLKSNEVKYCVTNTVGIDGLYVSSEGKFIFSDWKGSVYSAVENGTPELLLNTSAQNINAADFGVIVSKNIILIPTFNDNKVVCYTLPDIN